MTGKMEAGNGKAALLGVLEQILADLCRERRPEDRPTKDDLLKFLNSRDRKLNLYFIRTLPRETVAALRKDPQLGLKLFSALRELVIGLKMPLLNPLRVKSLIREAAAYPMAEVRRDPDLWAARALAALPLGLEIPLPLVALRHLLALIQEELEKRAVALSSIAGLDGLYRYIERELAGTPLIELYVKRAFELAAARLEPGEVVSYYCLLAERVSGTLTRLPPSPEKDRTLLLIKELTGVQDPQNMKLMFKKNAMARADELMKEARSYDELFELRFFFSQIGERSNRKLLSRKAGELARKLNIRAEGYHLLEKLSMSEIDEDGLLELVPAVIGKAESFVLNAPVRFLDRLLKFYLETACPLLRRLRGEPEKVPRLIQNFKRRVGLLNIYRDLEHVAQVMQRKMVLAICNPQMLAGAPERVLGYLTRLPPEFYPPEVMKVLRNMVREKGGGYRFTPGDVLCIFAAYPPAEEEEEKGGGEKGPGRVAGRLPQPGNRKITD